jgi:hypothetical protein
MTFLNPVRLSTHHCNPVPLRRSSLASNTRTRPTYGRWDSEARLSLLPAQIPVFAGPITRSSLTTVAGTEQTRTTTLTGTIPFITVWAIRAETIRSSLVTTSSTARTPPARRSATMAWATRLEWRPAQNGSVAVTWTRAMAHRRGTSSAWNFSSHPTH